MPAASIIREALINLMQSKKTNQIQQRSARNPAPPNSPENPTVIDVARENANESAAANYTADELAGARDLANKVQGEDPLAAPYRQNRMIEPERLKAHDRAAVGAPDTNPDDYMPGIARQDPGRFPDSNVQKERMAVMEEDFQFAQKEFERLAGRPPSPDEMKDIGTLENLVDILKDASGESRGRGIGKATIADDMDEIPF